jgi:predicted DNA-binding protein
MIRTQIYIPENLHKKLRYFSKIRCKSMAESICLFIEEGIEKYESLDISGKDKDMLRKISLLNFTGGDRDLSSNIDKIIYNNMLSIHKD